GVLRGGVPESRVALEHAALRHQRTARRPSRLLMKAEQRRDLALSGAAGVLVGISAWPTPLGAVGWLAWTPLLLANRRCLPGRARRGGAGRGGACSRAGCAGLWPGSSASIGWKGCSLRP